MTGKTDVQKSINPLMYSFVYLLEEQSNSPLQAS